VDDTALQRMAESRVRRLLVVDDGSRLVGVLSQADAALEAKGEVRG
jgi:CBS domain-containing protein